MRSFEICGAVVAAGLCWGVAAPASSTPVFSSDFETGLPSGVSGSGALAGVEGFGGLGPAGAPFSGQFLRNDTASGTVITLTGLPAHSAIDLEFLLAVIDSWDGSSGGFPSGDFLTVTVDGVAVFQESFENSSAGFAASYVAPPGVELARKQQLGFSSGSFFADSAYDMGLEPRFQDLAHSASTLTLQLSGAGQGYQGGADESWAIDNLRVILVPEPDTAALLAMGLLGALRARRRVPEW